MTVCQFISENFEDMPWQNFGHLTFQRTLPYFKKIQLIKSNIYYIAFILLYKES